MWHASGHAYRLKGEPSLIEKLSLAIAHAALQGVGDPELGEWIERGNPGPGNGSRIMHIRRRLSTEEVIDSGLIVRDLRDTPEGIARLRKLFLQFPQLGPLAEKIGEVVT